MPVSSLRVQRASVGSPIIEEHLGIIVVRDDLYPGGTKARAFDRLYERYGEIIYCCAVTSCTQISLATAARRLGKKATLFLAARAEPTLQTVRARELGADIHEVRPGYMSVVRSRGREYAATHESALLAPLGFDSEEVLETLAAAARFVPYKPDEVWCAAGSGVLTRALQRAWPQARHCAVQVGMECDVGAAQTYVSPYKFERPYRGDTEFPSERHFDAKAWDVCKRCRTQGAKVLFWNVLGELK